MEAVRSGEVDWMGIPGFVPEMYEALKDESGLQFASFPDSAYYMLAYNLRDGMLFADRNLRAALELCIDKPATVDAATNGNGDVLYSPVEPVSWAYQPDLPKPERDVDEARRLIESSGWIEGDRWNLREAAGDGSRPTCSSPASRRRASSSWTSSPSRFATAESR